MGERFIRESERRNKTGVPTSTWYELQDAGKAPKPVKIGPKAVAWLESEIDSWQARLVDQRDTAAANHRSQVAEIDSEGE